MRCALFTLVKRQIVDNAIYFAIALVISFVLIIATISIVLTEGRSHLSPYAIALLLAGPILFCMGVYTVGLIQVHTDRTSGVAVMLSILPVSRGRILLARIVVGAVVILMALGPLAIVGALLWKFLGPPDWLFHDWIADTFFGLVLTAFGCYCLGLHAGKTSETFAAGLRALPLVPILLLLIVIKGFGGSLLVVLVPFAILCLLHCWKPITCRIIKNITLGLMVLILLAVPLHLGRAFCDGLLIRLIDASAKISSSGLLTAEIENYSNVNKQSKVSSSYWGRYDSIAESLLGYDWASEFLKETSNILEPLGITEYSQSRARGERYLHSCVFFDSPTYIVHLNEVAGQLIYHCKYTESYTDWHPWQWKHAIELYIGPEGMSPIPSEILGRFGSSVLYFGSTTHRKWPPPPYIVYDMDSRCFYAIDVEKQKVYKGPELYNSSIQPIKIGLSAWSDFLRVEFDSPYGMHRLEDLRGSDYLSVLDETGRIGLLDLKTLKLHGAAGYLPKPETPFGWGSSKPKHLLDYGVRLITVYSNTDYSTVDETEGEYLGMVTGSISHQGMWTSVAVFDEEGNEIKTAHSKVALFDVPGGPLLTVMKFLFESLHPPVLALASYFTAYSFEARSAHRALFLMPNSFVALARDYQGNIFWTFLLVLLLMLPGLFFSGVLGWRVARDAAIYGLSLKTKRLWLLGTLAFGLPAYITYRLTRPKITLVTCANCGKPRRLDKDTCHQCGSSWHDPERTPPAWRVLDGDMVKEAKDDLRIG